MEEWHDSSEPEFRIPYKSEICSVYGSDANEMKREDAIRKAPLH